MSINHMQIGQAEDHPKDDLAKLDEIFDEQTIDDFELPKWWVEETKTALTQLITEAQQQAVEEYVIALVGEKCPDYEEGCTVCHAHALKEALND